MVWSPCDAKAVPTHLPLEGGGRRNAAGGGDPGREWNAELRVKRRTRHPTPELRSDPPPQGEGG
ncbi:hypothetical protein D4A92_13600 [Rhizobium rosettiformans]|uniref:Uncharacterized protein n=1 Tax=Rhizobium rosettiformans TaxID=1368430 RepID=A0ABX7EY03_9HYPH|nr:hypothetical protein D4A92_13600 [Rhizobium rosettiformans]